MDTSLMPISISDDPSLANPASTRLTASELSDWIRARAEQLDVDRDLAPEVLAQLGRAGLFRVGVPTDVGGSGGTILHAIEAVAAVAEDSLTAALVLWGQRAFIECLLQSENVGLRESLLPPLLNGDLAGAVALSNAMKFLSNIEGLLVAAASLPSPGNAQRWTLTGNLPWVTNLRSEGFVAAVAADNEDGKPPSIFAVPHEVPGVIRSDDLDLVGLRASNTAALCLKDVILDKRFQLASSAPDFLARVRPNFLGLQCGLSIGLARRSLKALDNAGPTIQATLGEDCRALQCELHGSVLDLLDGISTGEFATRPTQLFRLRLLLATQVEEAIMLEMHATGARGYIRGQADVARRRREAALIPIITPSVVQLRSLLDRYR